MLTFLGSSHRGKLHTGLPFSYIYYFFTNTIFKYSNIDHICPYIHLCNAIERLYTTCICFFKSLLNSPLPLSYWCDFGSDILDAT